MRTCDDWGRSEVMCIVRSPVHASPTLLTSDMLRLAVISPRRFRASGLPIAPNLRLKPPLLETAFSLRYNRTRYPPIGCSAGAIAALYLRSHAPNVMHEELVIAIPRRITAGCFREAGRSNRIYVFLAGPQTVQWVSRHCGTLLSLYFMYAWRERNLMKSPTCIGCVSPVAVLRAGAGGGCHVVAIRGCCWAKGQGSRRVRLNGT
ncbi:hypothetical protein EDB92DRAFT_2107238 [Lactarius akahatsu]|uniref:Uncharacterized protein n=1 Tax=Lactarius akahatsu TaxID=416441 RepID=A0AAD4L7M3_9AGAM|nr:hypothetical protein EDB92DRAFT_2107238 [Lactarius akahatsu]